MIAHRFRPIAFILCLFASHRAFALDWEIERNFRYFLYPSDVAAQRVARDLYIAQKGATPTPEQLEELMNGSGFWTMKLGQAGDLRKRWPIDWPRDDSATPYQLIAQMRAREGRPPLVPEQELDPRLGEPPGPRAYAIASTRRHPDGVDRDLLESVPKAPQRLRRLGRLSAGARMDRAHF
jgi:hypothetical protein